MKKYSSYFDVIFDEAEPVAKLGRGAHYSVFRAVSWHSPQGEFLPRAQNHDFAVIWDEDHDPRIINCVEELYFDGHLSKFSIFGERKANLTAIPTSDALKFYGREALERLVKQVAEFAAKPDHWNGEVYGIDDDNLSIILDDYARVSAYLNNIMLLWKLGGKPIPRDPYES